MTADRGENAMIKVWNAWRTPSHPHSQVSSSLHWQEFEILIDFSVAPLAPRAKGLDCCHPDPCVDRRDAKTDRESPQRRRGTFDMPTSMRRFNGFLRSHDFYPKLHYCLCNYAFESDIPSWRSQKILSWIWRMLHMRWAWMKR